MVQQKSQAELCEVHPCDSCERILGEVVAGSGVDVFLVFDGFPSKQCLFCNGKNVFFLKGTYLPFVVKAGFQVAKVRNVAKKGIWFFSGSKIGVFLW